eukprot:352915-Chlamydomonas_euryale.AAC.7
MSSCTTYAAGPVTLQSPRRSRPGHTPTPFGRARPVTLAPASDSAEKPRPTVMSPLAVVAESPTMGETAASRQPAGPSIPATCECGSIRMCGRFRVWTTGWVGRGGMACADECVSGGSGGGIGRRMWTAGYKRMVLRGMGHGSTMLCFAGSFLDIFFHRAKPRVDSHTSSLQTPPRAHLPHPALHTQLRISTLRPVPPAPGPAPLRSAPHLHTSPHTPHLHGDAHGAHRPAARDEAVRHDARRCAEPALHHVRQQRVAGQVRQLHLCARKGRERG